MAKFFIFAALVVAAFFFMPFLLFGIPDTATPIGLLIPSYSSHPARVASVGGFEAVGVLYPGL